MWNDIHKNRQIPIPEYEKKYELILMQLRINCDILKKEFSDHVNEEIKRFKKETNE